MLTWPQERYWSLIKNLYQQWQAQDAVYMEQWMAMWHEKMDGTTWTFQRGMAREWAAEIARRLGKPPRIEHPMSRALRLANMVIQEPCVGMHDISHHKYEWGMDRFNETDLRHLVQGQPLAEVCVPCMGFWLVFGLCLVASVAGHLLRVRVS